jgi:hypothetical protein
MSAVNNPPSQSEQQLTTAEILEKAAEYIEEHGWFRVGSDPHKEGPNPACAIVAMYKVCPDYLLGLVDVAFRREMGIENTPAWNNDPSRTKQEVTRMLRTVAAKLEVQDTDQRSGTWEPPRSTDRVSEGNSSSEASEERREAYSASTTSEDPQWHERVYQPI